MTRSKPHEPHEPHDDRTHDTAPLDPWMLDAAREAVHELEAEVTVPRDMMWARIQRARQETRPVTMTHTATDPVNRAVWPRWSRQFAAAAAVLVTGVGIGRYVVPPADRVEVRSSAGAPVALGDSAVGATLDPSRLAMEEHLARTVVLLTAVRDTDRDTVAADAGSLTPKAKELLATTRLLLDQPQLRDDRTRRLLQDLELVLVQIIQARPTAPETERAPRETLRDTDLLTRVRAIVTASAPLDGATYGGD